MHIYYSFPALILASMAISFYVYVPKIYAEFINVEQIGLIILISRLFDAFTDPLIGYLSDQTNSKDGRRKPWIKYSVLPLAIFFFLTFSVDFSPASQHFYYLLSLSLLFFLFWTAYAIPYEALGQSLVSDYNQRTVLFSYRDGAIGIGTLLAAALPAILTPLNSNPWQFIALIYSILLVVSTYFLNKHSLEKNIKKNEKNKFDIIENFKTTLSNKYFKQLLLAYIVFSIGSSLPATLFIFYVNSFFPEANSSALLAMYFLIGILTLPLWTKLSFRIGKKNTWVIALLINTFGFLGVYFLKPGQIDLYRILIMFSGLGYGATMVFPSSIQADVIDYEQYLTEERKEGQFLGVWSIAKKTVAAISAGIALWILGFYGFDAKLPQQTLEAQDILSLLYCLVPCLSSFLSILLIYKFDLNKDVHQKIMNTINKNE